MSTLATRLRRRGAPTCRLTSRRRGCSRDARLPRRQPASPRCFPNSWRPPPSTTRPPTPAAPGRKPPQRECAILKKACRPSRHRQCHCRPCQARPPRESRAGCLGAAPRRRSGPRSFGCPNPRSAGACRAKWKLVQSCCEGRKNFSGWCTQIPTAPSGRAVARCRCPSPRRPRRCPRGRTRAGPDL